MPTYYPESIEIDVEEFVDDCSDSEIEALISYIRSEGYSTGRLGLPEDNKWNDAVDKLIDSKWKLSVEDEATIFKICDKII
jgi:hypothetical protein